ncbi:polysaccharide deacetylase family protein [Kineococcus rubinsiae]|uniref:polysaccharide deacetylase family protein n=1 Tax=Kineococcus rubinsiae TaxID=2609562 RepID=UPI00142F936D|nr:polysaccharide deacetylase [Kineococcus rubinsiae]
MRPAEPVAWPDGRRAAAAFTFDVDAESAVLAIDPTSGRRMSVMSHQAYGPLVGVPRLLRLLERHGVRSTFFVPGFTALRHPSTVRDIAAAGHEIAHHGFLHESMVGLDAATEAAALDRGLDALEEVAGVRPVGFRAPMWELNWHTPGLLDERGFLYDSSLMDADVPYELALGPTAPGGRSIVEVPVSWGLDDWEQYCYLPDLSGSGLIEDPAKAVSMWRQEFTALREEGGCFVLTSHPFLSGRPGRAAALEGLVAEVAADPGTWTASLEEIARHVRGLALAPRSVLPLEEG